MITANWSRMLQDGTVSMDMAACLRRLKKLLLKHIRYIQLTLIL